MNLAWNSLENLGNFGSLHYVISSCPTYPGLRVISISYPHSHWSSSGPKLEETVLLQPHARKRWSYVCWPVLRHDRISKNTGWSFHYKTAMARVERCLLVLVVQWKLLTRHRCDDPVQHYYSGPTGTEIPRDPETGRTNCNTEHPDSCCRVQCQSTSILRLQSMGTGQNIWLPGYHRIRIMMHDGRLSTNTGVQINCLLIAPLMGDLLHLNLAKRRNRIPT